ncbi:MAG: acyl-CoA dehydrogenase family protein [Acidimicrobiia bacterium]|nr:acyl-CoA dehydrogenase family protein [Acidimicrobiia bacterium]
MPALQRARHGSDLASLSTRAEPVEGGWHLTGQKVWTSYAGFARWGICLARTDPDAREGIGISDLVVDMESAGIEVRSLVQNAPGRRSSTRSSWRTCSSPPTTSSGS